MSEFKEWERESVVEVPDVERWDHTKSQIRDVVYNKGSDYQTESIYLIKAGEGRRNNAITMYTVPYVYSGIPDTSKQLSLIAEDYRLMSESTGGGLSINTSSTADRLKQTMMLTIIDFKRLVDSVSPQILQGLSGQDMIDEILRFAPKVDFSGQFSVGNEGTGSRTFYNTLAGAWIKYTNSSGSAGALPTAMLGQYIYDNLPELLDSNGQVRFTSTGYSTYDYYRQVEIVYNYKMSLDILYLPRKEGYTRDQIHARFVDLMSGEKFPTNAKLEGFTSYVPDGSGVPTSTNNRWRTYYSQSPSSMNNLPTNLTQDFSKLTGTPLMTGYVAERFFKNNNAWITPSRTVAGNSGLPLSLQFDIIKYIQDAHPTLLPASNTRAQNAAILKSVDTRLTLRKNTVVTATLNNMTNYTHTGDETLVGGIWNFTQNRGDQFLNMKPNSSWVLRDGSTTSYVQSGVIRDIGFSNRSVKDNISDDGYIYVYWQTWGFGYTINISMNLTPKGYDSNGREIQVPSKDLRVPFWSAQPMVYLAMSDIFVLKSLYDSKVTDLQAQIDALKN